MDSIDRLREAEEKQRFIETFKKRYDDWDEKRRHVIASYKSYKKKKESPEKLARLFTRLRIKEKGEFWPRIVRMHRPQNLDDRLWFNWLKFLGYIMPHKTKTVPNLEPTVQETIGSGEQTSVQTTTIIGDWPMSRTIPKEQLNSLKGVIDPNDLDQHRAKVWKREEKRSKQKEAVQDLFDPIEN